MNELMAKGVLVVACAAFAVTPAENAMSSTDLPDPPPCEGSWELLPDPAPGPQGRLWTTMAFDSSRGRSVMFGGRIAPDGALNDTWEWDGNNWHHVAQDTGPTERVYGNMAYDAARQEVIYFGGRRPYSGTFLSETWAWNGVQWTLKSSVGPAREGFAMTYDSARQRVVLFGGHNGQYRNDVWEWDGFTWTNRTPSSGPAPMPRDGVAMAFDPNLNVTCVFGGFGSNGQPLADRWLWNGTNWVGGGVFGGFERFGHCMAFDANVGEVVGFGGAYFGTTTFSGLFSFADSDLLGPFSPLERHGAGLCFDTIRNRLVLTHGSAGGVHRLDTWEFDGVRWIPRAGPTPSPRAGSNMVYSPRHQAPLLIGGFADGVNGTEALADTWVHADGAWGEIAGFSEQLLLPAIHITETDEIARYGGLLADGLGPNVATGTMSLLRYFLTPSPEDIWEYFSSGPRRWIAASCWYNSKQCMVLVGGEDQSSIRSRSTMIATPLGAYEVATLNPFEATEGSAIGYDPIRDEAILTIPVAVGLTPETWRLKLTPERDPVWTPLGGAGLTPDHVSPWLQIIWNHQRGRLTLFTKNGPTADWETKPFVVMEWDGQAWVEFHTLNAPLWRARPAISVGGPDRGILVFGGVRFRSDCSCYEHSNATYEIGASDTFTISQSGSTDCLATLTLTVQNAAAPGLTFAWSRNGVPITDGLSGTGSTYSGTQSSSLQIQNLSARDSAHYTCKVGNLCSPNDGLAVVGGKVDVPYCCPADLTQDTYIDDSDFVLFATAYNILVCDDPSMPVGCPADLTGDGFVDDSDFVAFADSYNQLLCL